MGARFEALFMGVLLSASKSPAIFVRFLWLEQCARVARHWHVFAHQIVLLLFQVDVNNLRSRTFTQLRDAFFSAASRRLSFEPSTPQHISTLGFVEAFFIRG